MQNLSVNLVSWINHDSHGVIRSRRRVSLSLSAARRKEFQGVNWSTPVPLTRRGRSFEDLTSEPTCFRIPPGRDASKETGRLKGVD